MAQIVSLIQYVGKAGNTIGQKSRKSGIIFKQKAAVVRNPRTAAQMAQRARFKLAATVAGMLGEVGRISLQANGHSRTDRGELVKRLLRFITAGQNQAQLNYNLRLVNNPSYGGNADISVSAGTNDYTATFSGVGAGQVVAKAILVHDQTTGLWRHTSALDTLGILSIGKDANEAGHPLAIYAYGIVLDPKSEFADSNLSEVDDNGAGYLVNVEAVGSDNYDFSPTLSAQLTIAGDGTQNGGGNSGSGGDNGGNNSGGNNGGGGDNGGDLGE